jgi:Ca-activated chloride channel family protein
MFRFAHPEYLYALALVPVVVLLYILMRSWQRRTLKRLGDINVMQSLYDDASPGKSVLKLILFSAAYICIVIGLANPQFGSKLEEVKRKGVDIIVALDVSNSMLCEDIRPSRLERAKQAMSRLIDKLQNDRIGIVVFAGEAYVQLPITTDYSAAKLFLPSIEPDMIPTQGTAIGAAIDLSVKSFSENKKRNKALIIITDGENHEDNAIEAAKNAADQGIIVYTIGMGSPEGAPIPVVHNGVQVDYKKDESGNTVITKLNELMLREIAANGKGDFIRATNSDDGLNIILTKINKMEKEEFGSKMYTEYDDKFQYFLAAGLLFLVLDFFVSGRRSEWLRKLNLFGEEKR